MNIFHRILLRQRLWSIEIVTRNSQSAVRFSMQPQWLDENKRTGSPCVVLFKIHISLSQIICHKSDFYCCSHWITKLLRFEFCCAFSFGVFSGGFWWLFIDVCYCALLRWWLEFRCTFSFGVFLISFRCFVVFCECDFFQGWLELCCAFSSWVFSINIWCYVDLCQCASFRCFFFLCIFMCFRLVSGSA